MLEQIDMCSVSFCCCFFIHTDRTMIATRFGLFYRSFEKFQILPNKFLFISSLIVFFLSLFCCRNKNWCVFEVNMHLEYTKSTPLAIHNTCTSRSSNKLSHFFLSNGSWSMILTWDEVRNPIASQSPTNQTRENHHYYCSTPVEYETIMFNE